MICTVVCSLKKCSKKINEICLYNIFALAHIYVERGRASVDDALLSLSRLLG